MKLIVHADDFGFSKGITDNILECVRKGSIASSSVIPNGQAFDYAMQHFRRMKDMRLGIHLNLVEGKPLLTKSRASLLVDRKGFFRHSFQSLWFSYLFGSRENRELLKKQVRAELREQIKRVANRVGRNKALNVDSHQHFHMVPFVFDSLLELKKEFNIAYIRLPFEPFFFTLKPNNSARNYFGLNLAKHLLLNHLSRKDRPKIAGLGIKSSDYFVGNLFTGNMSEKSVEAALSSIRDKNSLVEILFHPGFALGGEESIWRENPGFKDFYYSDWRRKEFETVKSSSFARMLKQFSK
jgi:predicted glycoside hydrolase/deacetylase ChbG (UPF0249 family)